MPENRTLHIDATIELKDYFHAHLDTSKTKLIIASLIVAAVIGAFTYFFILIGEQEILWQLSPLFIGVPIVAIVGQILRLHAAYRKYIRELSDSQKNIHYIFNENGDGFDVVRGKSFSHIAWDSVKKIVERPRYFHFIFSKCESIIIPKRFLHGSDEELLKQIVASQSGPKAKLISTSQR